MKLIYVVLFVTFMLLTSLAVAGGMAEDFSGALDATWTTFAGTWEVQDGVLHQSEMGGPKVIVWEAPGELGDFTITVEARQLTSDADWGLAFRASDINNHYSWQYQTRLNFFSWYQLKHLGIYLYTPYSLVKSIIALIFSGFASSITAPLDIIKPPSLPTISTSFLQ